MYSTDDGELLHHSKSHIIRFVVFFSMMIGLSFLNIRFWHSTGYLFYIIVWSIVVRPDMEEDFKRTMLDFLSRRRLRQLYNYCNALFSDKKFKEYVETKKQSFKPRIDKIPT